MNWWFVGFCASTVVAGCAAAALTDRSAAAYFAVVAALWAAFFLKHL